MTPDLALALIALVLVGIACLFAALIVVAYFDGVARHEVEMPDRSRGTAPHGG